jgi:hypothetical protein
MAMNPKTRRLVCDAVVRIGESGASLARTQDEGIAEPYVEDEDAASGVPGRRDVRHVLHISLLGAR